MRTLYFVMQLILSGLTIYALWNDMDTNAIICAMGSFYCGIMAKLDAMEDEL